MAEAGLLNFNQTLNLIYDLLEEESGQPLTEKEKYEWKLRFIQDNLKGIIKGKPRKKTRRKMIRKRKA